MKHQVHEHDVRNTAILLKSYGELLPSKVEYLSSCKYLIDAYYLTLVYAFADVFF